MKTYTSNFGTEFTITNAYHSFDGYKPKDIAPLFAECVNLKNVKLPQMF